MSETPRTQNEWGSWLADADKKRRREARLAHGSIIAFSVVGIAATLFMGIGNPAHVSAAARFTCFPSALSFAWCAWLNIKYLLRWW